MKAGRPRIIKVYKNLVTGDVIEGQTAVMEKYNCTRQTIWNYTKQGILEVIAEKKIKFGKIISKER